MTTVLMRFIKIRNAIETGKADEMKLYDFCQSLDAVQARELINDVERHTHNNNQLYNFLDAFFPLLREDTANEMIREAMRNLSDMGLVSLVYDKDGNDYAIHIDPEQAERIEAYLNTKKGGEA